MITRKKLEEKLGVSSATISRYFNHPHLLKLELREKITKVILETGFIPNPLASKLAGKSKGKIALIIPDFSGLYQYQRFQSIYYLLLREINRRSLILEVIESYSSIKVLDCYDKIIYFGSEHKKFSYEHQAQQLFLFPDKPTNLNNSYVYLDHFLAGESLAKLFIPASHQTPLVLLPEGANRYPLNQILKGFKNIFKKNSLIANPHHFIKGANSFESGAALTQEGFALGLDFHCIIGFNQEALLGAAFILGQEGLSYPYDVQLVNFGHPREFYHIEHQISHFSDPLERIITLISNFIDGKTITEKIEPILIEGQTY